MAEIFVAGATGGREDAAGWAFHNAGENPVTFSHGNSGTEEYGTNLGLKNTSEMVGHVLANKYDLVFVGPEAELVNGIADELPGIPVFGPGKAGARLESSKAFMDEFSREFGIPRPDSYIARDLNEALTYADNHSAREYVAKADGLAGGKGAVLPDSDDEARELIHEMMSGKKFGEAGKTIVFEERLDPEGAEYSAFVVVDGKDFLVMPITQDHKRLLEGDKGPNTGGMGAYTSAELATPAMMDEIVDMAERTVYGLNKREIPYRGVIFLGLMEDKRQDKKLLALEDNVRFGDPETQVLMPALRRQGVNFLDICLAAANGDLKNTGYQPLDVANNVGSAALAVCLAAENYPDSTPGGEAVMGLTRIYGGVSVYHGGTRYDEGMDRVVTNGGRIVYPTGEGSTLEAAAAAAYGAIGPDGIHFKGMKYRTDIGHRALNK